ncbi:hypothetical protein [Metabacillus sp. 84]|uniref:Dph6-related ATP pyrophosphatase n=1 Tax=Metabacillus sp. 84 TaxID=3404705 RepID=UPI003CFA5D54
MKKTIVSWSGGKDSAMMLQVLLENQEIQVCGLFTAVDSITGQVPFHGVTKGLIAKQAEELDLPLHIIEIPPAASNKEYDKSMGEFLKTCRDQKILHAAYGDLFLADIKKYREELTARHGMKAIFPLWGERPDRLSKKFQSDGFLAVISGLDGARLPYDFLGRHYDESFVNALFA